MMRVLMIILLAVSVGAQSSSLPKPAPGKATYFGAAELMAAVNTAAVDSQGGRQIPVLDGTFYVVKSGQDYAAATMHQTRAEFHIIREGAATLVTGGILKSPTQTPNGDFIGSGIIGGERRVVKPGDVVFVPAGVPHQWEEVQGAITYYNFRFQQK